MVLEFSDCRQVSKECVELQIYKAFFLLFCNIKQSFTLSNQKNIFFPQPVTFNVDINYQKRFIYTMLDNILMSGLIINCSDNCDNCYYLIY